MPMCRLSLRKKKKKGSSVPYAELHWSFKKLDVLGAANSFRPLIAGTGYRITTGLFIHSEWNMGPALSSVLGQKEEETRYMTQRASPAVLQGQVHRKEADKNKQ